MACFPLPHLSPLPPLLYFYFPGAFSVVDFYVISMLFYITKHTQRGCILLCLMWSLYSTFYVTLMSSHTISPSQGLPHDSILTDSLLLQSDSPKWECSLQISETSWFGNFTFFFFNFQRKASRSDSVYVGRIQREEKKSVRLYRNHL